MPVQYCLSVFWCLDVPKFLVLDNVKKKFCDIMNVVDEESQTNFIQLSYTYSKFEIKMCVYYPQIVLKSISCDTESG